MPCRPPRSKACLARPARRRRAAAQKAPPPAPAGQKGAPQPQCSSRRNGRTAPLHGIDGIAPPKPPTDASLAAFRSELTAIAQKKDRPALAKLVLVQGFFWMKEDGNAAGKKTGIEALATALSLAAKDGSGWERLAEFAADETAAPFPDRPNTVCSPSGPGFQGAGSGKAGRSDQDRRQRLGLHVAPKAGKCALPPQPNAPVIEKLGMQFVWVMPDTAPNASQEFMRIVTPSGKVGFVPAEAINPLGSDQLCYGKDASGAWKIVGMIGGE